ncbi:acetyl-CoA carboxylase biotin carboxyl carrier protein [Halalkalibacter nanhaiisediminis]|uniref:Biotin carboxyl carrier protein of acetyl-CoA carboxylase n=1 Tax=Halalkalibacter nanhaiisediminis TaxID=688079 RepID=A0A562QLV1_9BACI|nr:acetyl-CoA carboxylase biotin carboxyl carrier protein [Halalkalibacter nanhaiisediminis]TWI57170.1 acetyl-CoA carboxylase biotin carboxyl carrier protein [Halalkalibacter nanhaiisediminis]
MYKINEIKELIRTLDKSSIDELTIKGEGKQVLTLRRNRLQQAVVAKEVNPVQPLVASNNPVTTAAPEQVSEEKPAVAKEQAPLDNEANEDATLHEIKSPMVGTFYSAPSPDDDPYVKVGDQVTTEKVVCIVEAMKLMNEIEAEVEGEIVEILVENGQLVEYGQPLFKVRAKA